MGCHGGAGFYLSRVKGAPVVQGLEVLACDSMRLLHVKVSFTHSSLVRQVRVFVEV